MLICTLVAAMVGVLRGGVALKKTALIWSVGTTGFAVMAVEIVLLYTFQVLYGYVYGMVGLVIGIFMFGLVLGSALMNRWLGACCARTSRGSGMSKGRIQSRLRGVLLLDAALCVFTVALIAVLALLRASAAGVTVQVILFSLVALAGVLGGVLFPLAASVWLHCGGTAASAAAAVDAADHVGASLGALVGGVVMVPILGVTSTCLAVGMMKLFSLLVVAGGIASERHHVRAAGELL